MLRPASPRTSLGPILVAYAAALTCWGARLMADEERKPPSTTLSEVVVEAKKIVPDEELTEHIEKALDADPYFYGEHVTITTINGVVHLEGCA